MVVEDRRLCDPASPLGDVAYLTRSAHRVRTLDALVERPRSRAELCELTGVSSSTVQRTLNELEARSWVQREGNRYVATRLGEAIATGMSELLARVETERKLRDVSHCLPDVAVELALDPDSEATVTVAAYDAPYRPVNRFRAMLEETDQFRFLGVDIVLLEPCREEFRERVLDGMEAEIVNPTAAARYIFSTYPEICFELAECDNMTGHLHDDVPPYGISLFDDRIAVNGYEPDSGGVTVLIDTESTAAREWAESVYADYRSEARPLEPQSVLE